MRTVIVYRCVACNSESKISSDYYDRNRTFTCNHYGVPFLMRMVSTGIDCGGYLLNIVPAQELTA